MIEIWVEYTNGTVECVDSTDTEDDAAYLVTEYRLAFRGSVVRVWSQHKR